MVDNLKYRRAVAFMPWPSCRAARPVKPPADYPLCPIAPITCRETGSASFYEGQVGWVMHTRQIQGPPRAGPSHIFLESGLAGRRAGVEQQVRGISTRASVTPTTRSDSGQDHFAPRLTVRGRGLYSTDPQVEVNANGRQGRKAGKNLFIFSSWLGCLAASASGPQQGKRDMP